MSGITVTRDGERLLAAKTAGPDDAARRRREAERLARLDHPGVVQFVDFADGPPATLHTVFVGTESWARCPPASAAEIVDGLAAVAATVADLHDLGTAHGAIEPDHVLIAGDLRPVLCGLADATEADADARRQDLDGLARLIEVVAARADPELKGRLEGLARRAERGDLTARALTAELDAVRVAGRRPGPGRRHIHLPGGPAAAAAAALVAVIVTTWLALRPSPPTATDRGESRARPADTAPVIASEPSPPATTAPEPAATPEPLADPLVIEHGGRRYGVGRADDIAVLGDWNCDGDLTPAVLQPAGGVVAVFGRWPDPESAIEADLVTVVDDAYDLRVDPEGTCGRLRVLHRGGSTLLTPELS